METTKFGLLPALLSLARGWPKADEFHPIKMSRHNTRFSPDSQYAFKTKLRSQWPWPWPSRVTNAPDFCEQFFHPRRSTIYHQVKFELNKIPSTSIRLHCYRSRRRLNFWQKSSRPFTKSKSSFKLSLAACPNPSIQPLKKNLSIWSATDKLMKREWSLGHLIGGQARRKAKDSWCKTPGIIGSPNEHQQHF